MRYRNKFVNKANIFKRNLITEIEPEAYKSVKNAK